MTDRKFSQLSRRERQIMDIVYRKGSASAYEVQEELTGNPSYSTVRALMRILEEKGFLIHQMEGQKYVYSPSVSKQNAIEHAISDLLKNFFNGSVEQAVSALIEHDGSSLTDGEYDRLGKMIEKARREGSQNE